MCSLNVNCFIKVGTESSKRQHFSLTCHYEEVFKHYETHLESSIFFILYFILIIGTLFFEETIHKKRYAMDIAVGNLSGEQKLSCNNP